MTKRKTGELQKAGRPGDYSGEVLEKICEYIQEGMTFREISKKDGMPHFTTLAIWRRTNPEFFYALKATEEDMVRANRRDMKAVADQLRDAAEALTSDEVVENYAAVKAAVDSLDRVSKVKVMEGDAPVADQSGDVEDQRRKFDDLHPLTQDRIRQALLEDQRLREGNEEEDDE